MSAPGSSSTATLSETEIEFGPTGERFRFRSDPTDPDCFAFDFFVAPGGGVKETHRHCGQSEAFRCVSGSLDVTVDGKLTRLEPGDEVTLPPGSLHSLVNSGDTEVHCEVEYRPAGRNREWFLLHAAFIDRTGREPGLLDIAPFVADVDIYLSPPLWLQRVAVRWIVGPLAIVLGRRRRMLAFASDAYGRDFVW